MKDDDNFNNYEIIYHTRWQMRSIVLIGITILLLMGAVHAEISDVGYIYVCSMPAGGSVYVDGNYKGITKWCGDYIKISTTPGYHTVEIFKDGYENFTTSVYVTSGDIHNIDALLIHPPTTAIEIDQTDWKLVSAILTILLITTFVLIIGKAKRWSPIEIFLLVIVMALVVLMWYTSDSLEPAIVLALLFGIAMGLVFFITKIGEGFKKLIKGEKALRPQANRIEKPIPPQKYKIKRILLIILLIAIGSIGYTFYQKYSPLAELADCGKNCIDYKKVSVAQYETPVPDIKITNADAEKLIMDVPIIIRNPSAKDTETVKIDFDLYMEGKNLTKGTIPAYELPAMQNTTILIKDVVIKYEELREVFQVVATRHGDEIFREGKANISMTADLLIYFPIEVFSINIYTFTIPIQIETDVPIDMLKQNEEAKKQIEEKVRGAIKEVQDKMKGALPTQIPTTIPTSAPTLPSLPTSTPTLPLPTPTLPQFP